METFLIIAGIIVIVFGIIKYQQKLNTARRLALMQKYNNLEIVDRIMNKCFWQGQSPEQLRDSLGPPEYIDSIVMKSKTKEVWKYYRRGANRYGLRVNLENDVVVGWDKK